MAIKYLDGRRFRRAVIAGADWVRHRRHHLNEINVFPVPDGDTGTNMALSLSATANALRDEEAKELSKVTQKAAEASVMGAKGNSGIILAHWFQGLARHIGEARQVGTKELAAAMDGATRAVYEAVEKPLEGTILTVMRASSETAHATATRTHDIAHFLDEVLDAAQKALERTPDMLEVLREAHVVDAGAAGYVNFLQGMQRAVAGVPLPDFEEEQIHEVVEHPPIPVSDITNRYCTELVVRGKGFRPEALRRRFKGLGDCLMVITTGELFKLHVHTNHPDEAQRIAAKLGVIVERKVDDMLLQAEEREGDKIAPVIPIERQPKTVAVVCDSTADLDPQTVRELGIEMVPLQVMFGDEVFRDQIDLKSAEFYERLQTGDVFPTTSQPAPRAFVEAFDRVRSDREIVVCTVSAALSGTFRSAQNAVRLANHPRVEVFDADTASAGLGLQTIGAARLARMGADVDTILHWLGIWRKETHCLFTPSTLEYLRRGGRMGRAQGIIGSLLHVRPILGFLDGRVQAFSKVRGDDKAVTELRSIMQQRVAPGTRIRAHLVESTESGRMPAFKAWVEENYDVIEFFQTSITAVVGAHIGPKAWGIFWQVVRDDDPTFTGKLEVASEPSLGGLAATRAQAE